MVRLLILFMVGAFGACGHRSEPAAVRAPQLLSPDQTWGEAKVSDVPIDFQGLLGVWEGKVSADTKDWDKLKLHTPSETGSVARLEFKEETEGTFVGQLVLGQTRETWRLTPVSYQFEDALRRVSTQRIAVSRVPAWIIERLPSSRIKETLFYEFSSCRLVDKPQECTIGVDIAKGSEHGIWSFSKRGNRLWTNVYYEYTDTRQKRVVELLFTKK